MNKNTSNLLYVCLMLGLGLTGLTSCEKKQEGPTREQPKSHPQTQGDKAMKIESTAFAQGQVIPQRYTGDGEDISPPLSWSGLPAETKEIALICDDPDAPSPQPLVHWVIYNIPPDTDALPEGIKRKVQLTVPAGARQGKNSWSTDNIGYRGPAPPPGPVHYYHFKLFALDAALDTKANLDKNQLLKAMKSHILDQTELIGTYQR